MGCLLLEVKTCLKPPNMIRDRFGDIPKMSIKLHPNREDKTLIVWDPNTECRDSTRDMTDNVANLFWPRVMSVSDRLSIPKYQKSLYRVTHL